MAVMGEQLLRKRKPGINVVAGLICHGGEELFLRHCCWPFFSENCSTQ